MGGKGAAKRDPAQPDTLGGRGIKNKSGRQFSIMQIMRAQAGLWPKAIAHNFLHYVTLPPDKTIAQYRDGTGLSGCHRASHRRTARA